MNSQLPQGANIESKVFKDMVKGSLSESLGLWPADFSRFVIESIGDSPQRRLLGGSRRLAAFTFDISYELMVRDLKVLGRLQRDLNSLGTTDSSVFRSFTHTLLANG